MMDMIGATWISLVSFIAGVVVLFGLMIYRMWGNPGRDDSNLTNPVRALVHFLLHRWDFLKMYYLDATQLQILKDAGHEPKRPFDYWDKDELSEVVNSRPD